MNQCCCHIFKTLKLTLLGILLPLSSFAQNQINTVEVEDSVRSLLEKYVILAGQIRPEVQPDPARPFILLFRNPLVQVYNDLNVIPGLDVIKVRYYSETIKNLFPEGLKTKVDFSNLKIGKIPDDETNRKVVEVKVKKTVAGVVNGQKYQHTQKVIFMVGFDVDNGEPGNFLIHGIKPVVEHDHDLILAVSPSISRILNHDLLDDQRFELPWETSWRAGLHYQYMISSSWGIGIGLDGALNRHRLVLDKFDPMEGHNPNLLNVEWAGELYYLECPLYAVYHYQLFNRIILEAQAGVFGGYCIFEDIQTSAMNRHSGELLYGVMSDPFEYSSISRFDLGISMALGISFVISPRISLFAQVGFMQGLHPLEKDPGINLAYGIYQGQYNPLFYKTSSSNYSQSFPGTIGLTYRIFGSKLLL